MKTHLMMFLMVALCLLTAGLAQAGITSGGEVTPANPATWTSTTTGTIGQFGNGGITVDGGSDLFSSTAYMGQFSSGYGIVDVWDSGSTWTNSGSLYVGYQGGGRLNIGTGGQVSYNRAYIAEDINSLGWVDVAGSGSTFNGSGELNVGYYGDGELKIWYGADATNGSAKIGVESGSIGLVTVDGVGSTWTNYGSLYIGNYGEGHLFVQHGAEVDVSGETWVGKRAGGSGSLQFIAVPGVTMPGLLTTFAYFGPAPTGYGTMSTQGLVSDMDVVFDSSHGLNQTFGVGNVTIDLNGGSGFGPMGAGYKGSGSLTVDDGVSMRSTEGYLGYWAGSTGVGTVDGSGSTWTVASNHDIGRYGNGTLNVIDGGDVVSEGGAGYLGRYAGSVGTATVDGNGSTWSGFAELYIGDGGSGSLNVLRGGDVIGTGGDAYVGHGVGSAGTVTVNGSGSIWVNNAELFIGDQGYGRVDVYSGGVVYNSGDAHIGQQAGSTGTMHVNGADSTWSNAAGTVHVGENGTGYLEVVYGGYATNHHAYIGSGAAGTGQASVTWGATWDVDSILWVGRYGDGRLDVSNGGIVNTGSSAQIGLYTGSTGEATITGSLWTISSTFVVGNSGEGTLNITNGGRVEANGIAYIGASASGLTSEVLVDGVGSTWEIGSELSVAYQGKGVLVISDDGSVSSAEGHVGDQLGSVGEVRVDGAGSAWVNSGLMYIGELGNGTLDITNGGAVNNTAGTAIVGHAGVGEVTIDGTGSIWTSSAAIVVGNMGEGTLEITNGGQASSNVGSIASNGGSTGNVLADGAGSQWFIVGGLGIGTGGEGTLELRRGGMTYVGGDATFGTLGALEIGLTGGPMESFLDVTGVANLAGDLSLSFLDGYAPALGESFLILDAASLTGAFASFTAPSVDWYIDYDLALGDVWVRSDAVGPLVGDFDNDGDLDADDIDLLFAALGGGDLDFDLTGDSTVDQSDVDEWLAIVPIGEDVGTVYADFNLDGAVDAGDLALLGGAFGQAGPFGWANGDATGDGVVDAGDLAILGGNFGTIVHPVPEPASAALLLTACLPVLRRRNR